jgi:putative solute:sodium symporter small subunit
MMNLFLARSIGLVMASETQVKDESRRARGKLYWRKNLRLVLGLLCVWFVVSYGAGILLVDPLDRLRVAGFKLGFWFAQQGSILVFVGLIAIYVRRMKRLDREYQAGMDASE